MSTTPAAAVAVDPNILAMRAGITAESDRITAITQLAREHNMSAKLSAWINGGTVLCAVVPC